jgi:hypothetical protein
MTTIIQRWSRGNRRDAVLRRLRTLAWASLAVALTTGQAYARDAGSMPGWQFYFSPYTWVSGITGTTTIENSAIPPQTSHLSFGSLFSHLNSVPIIGAFEVRNGRFGILSDLMLISLSANLPTPGPLFNGASTKLTQLLATVLPSYRVFGASQQALDVGVGVRTVALWSRITFNSGLLPEASNSTSVAWADPIVGLRYRFGLTDRWSLTAYGDAGATGSTSTWQAMGLINYQLNGWLNLHLGYRYLDIDYRGSKLNSDTAYAGPIIGATIRF